MIAHTISIALAIVSLRPFASAQWVQTNRFNDRQVPHHPLMGTKASQTLRELSGYPTLHRRQSPHSQIYVIDTAIVRATKDTTRHLYSFNARAKRTCDVMQHLRGGLWVDTLRHTDGYDSSNNMLSDLLEGWSNGQWVNAARNTYTYDANGHLLSDLFQVMDSGWLNYGRFTYSYDANGNMVSDAYVFWSYDQFLVYHPWRNTFTYDNNGHMLTELHEVGMLGPFENDNRWAYTYDSAWHMVSEVNERWSNGQWVYGQRDTYTYIAEGKMAFELTELWSNGLWVNSSHNTYTYDSTGNLLSLLGEEWTNNQWMNSERYAYTSDAEGNVNSLWHYRWLNPSWVPTDIGEAAGFGISDSASNAYSFGNGYNFNLIRRLIVAGVASQSGNVPETNSLSQNYPNPFNPSTTIKYELPHSSWVSLRVYDVLGREVSVLVNERRDAGIYEVKFDGSNLASWVYFYRLEAGDFVQVRKMLVLK